jgi:hypothetical protein
MGHYFSQPAMALTTASQCEQPARAEHVTALGPEGRASALASVFFLLPAGSPARFTGRPRKSSGWDLMPMARMFFAAFTLNQPNTEGQFD